LSRLSHLHDPDIAGNSMKKFTLNSLALLAALLSTAALAQSNISLPGLTPRPSGSPVALPPGLYVSVLDGMIKVTNPIGTSNFAAGQFGYTASITRPPVVVPANPGLKFTPPPTFSNNTGPTSNTTGGSKSIAIDCEVR
jgi:hypothetical protein